MKRGFIVKYLTQLVKISVTIQTLPQEKDSKHQTKTGLLLKARLIPWNKFFLFLRSVEV